MIESSMHWLDVLVALTAGVWVELACAAVALAALGLSLRLMRRAARDRQRVESLRRDLQAFTEASTRVADTLNHLLAGEVSPPEASAPSRRYLLIQAREGLESGESVDALTRRLDLCEDERRLLECLQTGSGMARVPEDPARRAWVA